MRGRFADNAAVRAAKIYYQETGDAKKAFQDMPFFAETERELLRGLVRSSCRLKLCLSSHTARFVVAKERWRSSGSAGLPSERPPPHVFARLPECGKDAAENSGFISPCRCLGLE